MPTTETGTYYEVTGPDDGQPLLLVNGFTSQMSSWDPQLMDELWGHGFRVVAFDNRDVGLSPKTEGTPPEVGGEARYTIVDMAADGMAVLDAVGIDAAHVVGVSMGGMIAQQMALDFPDRVLSLTSIMSTTGDRSVGQSTPDAMAALMKRPPEGREAYLDQAVETAKIIGGPHVDTTWARERAAGSYDRCFNPAGAAFQMAAILASPDRTPRLGEVRCPALVVHGRVDPLVTLSGGEATAAAIPGAELLVLDEMGHDLPRPLMGQIVDAIAKVAARA
jgi:pimeloyl-ACP methyl ester carboxylesterase